MNYQISEHKIRLFRFRFVVNLFSDNYVFIFVFGYTSDIFFPYTDGGRLKYYAYRKYLEETSERVLHRRVTPHIWRHTHCSKLAECNYPLEEISARLGHSDSRITREIYLHRMKEVKERANRQLDAIHMIG